MGERWIDRAKLQLNLTTCKVFYDEGDDERDEERERRGRKVKEFEREIEKVMEGEERRRRKKSGSGRAGQREVGAATGRREMGEAGGERTQVPIESYINEKSYFVCFVFFKRIFSKRLVPT